MKRLVVLALAASSLYAADGFVKLFNGKSLDGWDGDPRLWKVENRMIVGSTDGVKLTHNTFLITRKSYGDFHVRMQVKLRNHNSGIQFRSEALPDWVVRGYQADMAENNYWGCLYDERGKRGIIADGWKGKAETVVKLKDWNDYEIIAKGDHLQIKVNGLTTVDLHDEGARSGVIALQLHQGPGMQVWFRNLRIRELK